MRVHFANYALHEGLAHIVNHLRSGLPFAVAAVLEGAAAQIILGLALPRSLRRQGGFREDSEIREYAAWLTAMAAENPYIDPDISTRSTHDLAWLGSGRIDHQQQPRGPACQDRRRAMDDAGCPGPSAPLEDADIALAKLADFGGVRRNPGFVTRGGLGVEP